MMIRSGMIKGFYCSVEYRNACGALSENSSKTTQRQRDIVQKSVNAEFAFASIGSVGFDSIFCQIYSYTVITFAKRNDLCNRAFHAFKRSNFLACKREDVEHKINERVCIV